ncbi:MAG: COX15/CtaA family protein [Gammaproteobacteria bacterium WSBS_2016_MAG_OTU1]
MHLYRRLLLFAIPLTLFVVVAGAYTRLSDAGLGCPDWPGCYGKLLGVPDAATAAAHSPDSPLDTEKAWIEVFHRYIAAALGILLVAAAFTAAKLSPKPRAPFVLVALVIAQGLLGMLTVTDKLRPIVVSMHLMGGFLIFGTVVYATTVRPLLQPPLPILRSVALVALVIFIAQVFLGGWVSANYAALSCPDFPLCQGGWLPPTIDWSGFALGRELHLDDSGAPISAAALATIHWAHRLGALCAAIALGWLGWLLWQAQARAAANMLWILLGLQILLGIANVALGLPLWTALLHNAVAALIAATMGIIMAKISLAKTGGHS